MEVGDRADSVRLLRTISEDSCSEVRLRRAPFHDLINRRSSEIQGTALGKCLRAWSCIYRSMPAGVAQSRHAFVGGTVSTWAR